MWKKAKPGRNASRAAPGVAKLRSLNTDKNRLLLKIDMDDPY
jgi:hypothetical protein